MNNSEKNEDYVNADDLPLLTERELEVLKLIADGQTAKEVARCCNISPRTVQHHIENIRHKLRARNSAHVIAKAALFGALGSDASDGARGRDESI